MSEYHYEQTGETEFTLFDECGDPLYSVEEVWIGHGEDFMFLKHGSRDSILRWVERTNQKARDAGCPHLKVQAFNATGAGWSLEDINKCLSICDYFGRRMNTIDVTATKVTDAEDEKNFLSRR